VHDKSEQTTKCQWDARAHITHGGTEEREEMLKPFISAQIAAVFEPQQLGNQQSSLAFNSFRWLSFIGKPLISSVQRKLGFDERERHMNAMTDALAPAPMRMRCIANRIDHQGLLQINKPMPAVIFAIRNYQPARTEALTLCLFHFSRSVNSNTP